MDFWTAIVAIVSVSVIAGVIIETAKAKSARKESPETERKLDELERRIESLESIIIELDRDKKYRDLK
jgi:hypothetical protein